MQRFSAQITTSSSIPNRCKSVDNMRFVVPICDHLRYLRTGIFFFGCGYAALCNLWTQFLESPTSVSQNHPTFAVPPP
jgi:hypothetical protein